ncbi:MAG: tetratricopeptide repeat protein [Methanobrevibacter millerae]|uniref:Tetratricopeptide repeat protein n=1 Tax=Methanobrevibacter millerae TaxID=230361 RepID=A0A8T3V7Z5_9EURY|nr:tetratricopeptide repeat protein [Methanobrevibacter millerae]MBE6504169.1 tetratricopeptide repeat protein [Methanobrevibacter millerae]
MSEKLIDHYEEEKNYEEVIRLIDEMILNDPEKASSLLFRKAEALVALEKCDQAITTLKVYVKDCSEKEKIKSYILIASCYMNIDNDKKAEEYLVKILDIDPENDIILKQLSYMAYINQNFERCCYLVKILIKIDKADIEDYINMIFCCIQLDRIDEALKYAEKVIELDPTNLDVFATLTIVYENMEDEKKLNEVCERIINLKDDGTLQIILLKAQAYLELGKKEEAFEFINKAIKLYPYDPFPYLMKGILYNKLAMFEQADECFNEAFMLNPEIFDNIEKLN